MKQKLFRIFCCLLLSASMVTQAQLLDAVNDSPEGGYVFDESGQVSGRNNAPMATTNWTFTWSNYELDSQDELGGQGGGYKLWGCEFTRGNNSSGTYPAFDIYLGYTTALNYGRINFPPTGSYTMLTSASSLSQINGRVFSNSTFQTAYCTSSSKCGQFKVGNINLAAGRHGYPYLTTTSNFGTSSSASTKYNITIGDSRAFSETYTTVRVATDEENGKGVLWATNNTNTITLVFDLSSFDANIGIPAGTYTIGTNVRGGAFDEDGYTRWIFTSGSVTISKSGSSLSLSTSSLRGVSSGSTFNLSCTISNKTPNRTFTSVICTGGMLGGGTDSPYFPFKVIGSTTDGYQPYFYSPYSYVNDLLGDNGNGTGQTYAYWTSVDASNNKMIKPSGSTTFKQGIIVMNYSDRFLCGDLTTGIMGNDGTFYYVKIWTNQVSYSSGLAAFAIDDDRNATFGSVAYPATTPTNVDPSDHSAFIKASTGNYKTDLPFYVDPSKDGVIPTGRYEITSSRKPGTVLLGTYDGGYIYGAYCEDASYDYYLRCGMVDVFNLNETYYIHSDPNYNAHGKTCTYTIGTAPKDITLTTPAANGTAQIQFTATNWNNKVLTYASGTAHKFFEGQTISLQATPASGYQVAYWTLGGVKINGSESQNTYSYTVGSGATQTLSAVFEQASTNFHLAWDANGGVLVDNEVYSYAVEGDYPGGVELPDGAPNATREGYQLTGWYDAVHDLTWTDDDWTMPNHDVTYVAQWTAIDYEINFYGNGGTGSFFNLIYTIEEDDIVLWTDEDIEKTGYTFGGWYDNVGLTGNPVTTIPAGSTGNKDFYAKWIINTYTITWKDADGTTLETDENVAYGTTPTYNGSNPTKEADSEYTYAFNGWTPAVATVTTDATYTAAYSQTKVQYTLTWNFDGGTTATAEGNYTHGLIDWGTAITAPANPTKDGYTFNGWNTTPAATMPAANVTYTAQWVSASAPVVLYDYKDNDYYNNFKTMYNGKTINVTYERQFTKGRWSTLCLPFNVNKAMFSNLNFGSRIYEFKYATGNADTGVNLYFSIAKSIEAGKGYIVNADDKLAKRTSFTFRGVNIDLSADSVAELNSVTAYDKLAGNSSEGNIELVGTLRKGTLKGTDKDNRYMGLKENKIYYPNIATGSTILAYRGIFRSIEGTLNAERIRIIVDGEEAAELEVINGELQDVQETKKFIENGVLYIERNGVIYDATGRKVE